MNSEREFAVFKFSSDLNTILHMPVRIFVISANLFIQQNNKVDLEIHSIVSNKHPGFNGLIVGGERHEKHIHIA